MIGTLSLRQMIANDLVKSTYSIALATFLDFLVSFCLFLLNILNYIMNYSPIIRTIMISDILNNTLGIIGTLSLRQMIANDLLTVTYSIDLAAFWSWLFLLNIKR